jgi:hypothetical protein
MALMSAWAVLMQMSLTTSSWYVCDFSPCREALVGAPTTASCSHPPFPSLSHTPAIHVCKDDFCRHFGPLLFLQRAKDQVAAAIYLRNALEHVPPDDWHRPGRHCEEEGKALLRFSLHSLVYRWTVQDVTRLLTDSRSFSSPAPDRGSTPKTRSRMRPTSAFSVLPACRHCLVSLFTRLCVTTGVLLSSKACLLRV